MFLHYGITHAPFVLLASVSLLVFVAGLLLGTRLGGDTSDSQDRIDNAEQ